MLSSHEYKNDLSHSVIPYLNHHKRIAVAYSGGLDSSVLLHVLSNLRKENNFSLIALHIDHGLSQNEELWNKHCENFCRKLHVPCVIKEALIEGKGNIECKARNIRYNTLAEMLEADEVLMTGHHMEDQVETFFLALKRGSGVTGLISMPEKRKFNNTYLIRPFLSIPKETLEDYAEQHNIDYIHDESNDDLRFDRNFIRHVLLPEMRKHWPDISYRVTDTINQLQSLYNETTGKLKAHY